MIWLWLYLASILPAILIVAYLGGRERISDTVLPGIALLFGVMWLIMLPLMGLLWLIELFAKWGERDA